MATETMIRERPIRILPVFIGEYLIVLAWVGDTPIFGFVHHLILMSCPPADKYPKSPGFERLTLRFNEGTVPMGRYINRHALIFR